MSPILAYILGFFTVPLGMLVWAGIEWARDRSWSGGGCPFCEEEGNGNSPMLDWFGKSFAPDEVNHLTYTLRDRLHQAYSRVSPWHKKALGHYWRQQEEKRAQGIQIHVFEWDKRYMQ